MKNIETKGIPNKWFYFSVILLTLYFLIRIIDQSKLMWIFPLDFTNDHSAHMAMLYFLKEYGFGNIVPNWYGGFPLLKFYHPFSSFYALPFYYLFKNVQVTMFFTMMLTYILSFIAIFFLLGKNENLSKIKRIVLFLFFFGSPWGIGYFLRVGKYSELLGFFLFILLFTMILWYKDHKLDWWFLFFIPLYSLLSITHISVFFVGSFLILSLFLIKTNKERVFIIFSGIIAMVFSSWWWWPFIRDSVGRYYNKFYGLQSSLMVSEASLNDKISSFIIPIMFIIIFYFYWKTNNKPKKELVFYSIILIVSLLILTRIAVFIPFMNRPIVDTYNLIFLFLTIFLFLKINFNNLSRIWKKLFYISLILIPLFFICVSFIFTPFFIEHTQENKDIIGLFDYVDGKIIMVGDYFNYGGYYKALYSYGAIYYNMTTPDGWTSDGILLSYTTEIKKMYKSFDDKDCQGFISYLNLFDTTNVITDDCAFLERCELKLIKKNGKFCLYSN